MKTNTYYNRHYYNQIPYSPWPMMTCISAVLLFFYSIIHWNKLSAISPIIYFAVIFTIGIVMIEWFSNMVWESSYRGIYNIKLKSTYLACFILFLISEIMFFAGFFWVLFDRMFNVSYETNNMWVPIGLEHIRVYRKPLVATMVLVTSGYTANYAFYMVMVGNYESAYWYAWFTSIWAWLFLFIQFIEYNTLITSISDTVFGSIFFLITGFHGIHVLIGTIFITIQYDRISSGQVGSYGYVGCFCATIYWHFVDCIWLVVYSVMYVSMYWEFMFEC